MKHTPGPWSLKYTGDYSNPDECIVTSVLGEKTIHIYSQEHAIYKYTEGDAALIAAAPDLLEACYSVLSVLCEKTHYNDLRNEDLKHHMDAIVTLKNAIAKAEGR